MDQATRNSLQNATQQARRLLEREIAEQLEGTFDALPNGIIAEKPGKHLDASQRLVRTKIVESIRHRAGGSTKADMLADAVADYVREAAFTILNRYIALKMLEVRGLVQQCITKGDQSSGFKEFGLAATGLAQLPDKGYRLYLESLFDELSTEVKILFDRHSDASLLWPRRQAFDGLLEILNTQDIASVWKEDETIGWVYQYFNSQEERRAMRDASQAPRNSRELAVRNQFFTPRYVVEFLTENTLARIWYEMRQGKTSLVEKCVYLVRRPTEVFLEEGSSEPTGAATDAGLSQDELFKQPLQILFRAKKDPRDLKVLDPACGSSHFLIYCFDILLTIYREAWSDDGSPASQVTGHSLKHDYPTIESLHAAVPGLVLRHNLYGIDIDARCAQIGAFALWMRAQRAYNDYAIPKDQRLAIRKSNIVVAEPMPGEDDLLKDFLRGLREDRLESLIRTALNVPADTTIRATTAMADSLCGLVRTIWTSMKLSGDVGSLLQIDKDLEDAIAQGRADWEQRLPLFRVTEYGLGGVEKASLVPELPGESADFWAKSEALVLHALRIFSNNAEQSGAASFRRGLFAEDAARGLAFIDIVRNRFDTVLMNPPFGLATPAASKYVTATYPDTYVDLYACFVSLGCRLAPRGYVGAITSRAFLMTKKLLRWRRNQLVPRLAMLADLGIGVMDSAFVEACAYVLGDKAPSASWIAWDYRNRLSEFSPENVTALAGARRYIVRRSYPLSLPSAQLLYNLPVAVQQLLSADADVFEPNHGTAREGLRTFDDFRFVRLRWEVSADNMGCGRTWEPYSKGGTFARYYSDLPLVVKWNGDGDELAEENRKVNGQIAQARQASEYYRRPGITYSKRSAKGFSARVLPAGYVFGTKGPAVLPYGGTVPAYLAGWLNARLITSLIELQANASEFNTGIIKRMPWHMPGDMPKLIEKANAAIVALRAEARLEETHPLYSGIPAGESLREVSESIRAIRASASKCLREASAAFDIAIDLAYGVDSSMLPALVRESQDDDECEDQEGDDDSEMGLSETEDTAWRVVSFAVGVGFGRWKSDSSFADMKDDLTVDPFGDQNASALGEHGAAEPNVLADDPGGRKDIVALVEAGLRNSGRDGDRLLRECLQVLGMEREGLRGLLAKRFFDWHLKRHTKSRRRAPVYWQLATGSASFSIWLVSQRASADQLFVAINDVVLPRVRHEREELERLRNALASTGSGAARAAVESQEGFVDELQAFAEELRVVAALWKPHHDDGAVVVCAPLWRLLGHHRA